MVTIGSKTKEIGDLYNAGLTIEEIARRFQISKRGVEKRLNSYKKLSLGLYPAVEIEPRWTLQMVKEGFDRFLAEHGRLPTAYEVDDTSYLPSSRQIQRRFGGLSALREQLGYKDVHFGKGKHRRDIQARSGLRGGNAEDELERLLIDRFGELFVHSERRFGDNRNRVDFVVYARDKVVGIDVFATDDKRTLIKNIGVKMPKYINFPSNIPLFFVVWGDGLTQEEIDIATKNTSKLASYPSLRVVNSSSLLNYLATLSPLTNPDGYSAML